MRGMLFVGLYLLAMLAHANVAVPGRDALRYRTETDPHGLIADMRQQLDQLDGSAAPAQERDLLWLMGTAAVNVNDDTALTEALLRLDSLAAARHYELAAASAGFLRSRHLIVGLLYLLLRAQRRYASELRIQALRDPLTGVDNRRAFMQRALDADCPLWQSRHYAHAGA